MTKRLYFPLIVAALALTQCNKSDDPTPADECDGVTATYTSGIQTIIQNSCALAGCHAGDVPQPKFDSYAAVKAQAGSIQSHVTQKLMPPAGSTPLTTTQINQINCWVKNGAPES